MMFIHQLGQQGTQLKQRGHRWDPAFVASPLSLSNNDQLLTLAQGNSSVAKTVPTLGNGQSSGKWYCEFRWIRLAAGGTTSNGVGVATSDFSFGSANLGGGTSGNLGAGLWPDSTGSTGRIYRSGTFITGIGITEPGNGDIIMVAMDVTALNLWFGVNGTWHNSGNPASGTNPSVTSANLAASKTWFPACSPWTADAGVGNDTKIDILSSIDECVYAVPSGFAYW
jgi:hypothetical protein